MTKEHMRIALALEVPLFCVVTKLDMCPKVTITTITTTITTITTSTSTIITTRITTMIIKVLLFSVNIVLVWCCYGACTRTGGASVLCGH
jgi:GTPase